MLHGSYNTNAIRLFFLLSKVKKKNPVLKAISTLINRPEQCVQGNGGTARLQEQVFSPNYIKDSITFCAEVEAGKRRLIFW